MVHCKYVGHKNGCQHLADGHSEFCFWHDAQVIKNTSDIKARLEFLFSEGHSLEGFELRNAQLSGVNLAGANLMGARLLNADLSGADLTRANLAGARLFQANLSGASLFKANLENANLNEANLENANLLGIRLENARLEHTYWGKFLLQEKLAIAAQKAGKKIDAQQLYGEAEEVARYLTNESEKRRQYDVGGYFYQLERVMRRMQMRPFSGGWLWSKLVDILCGYGENAARVISFSLSVILMSAMVYFFLGVRDGNGMLIFNADKSIQDNALCFLECVYFSVITFTTTGYGDISPVGFSRVIAASEAFIGAFAISLFVVVFMRKMTQ